MTETTSLEGLAAVVDDGDVVAFGGKTLHRAPMAFVRALARRDAADLTLVGLAKSMDVDLLCGLDRVAAVHYGYVGFEHLGLAPAFRRDAEAGRIDAHEGTCYTVVTMLRGAKQGVPFLPVAGLGESALPEVNPFLSTVADPFTGESTAAVRALTPDVGVIHATEADEDGNAHIAGADLTEGLIARAADVLLVTAERVVPTEEFEPSPDRTDVPGFLVDGVAEAPYGAHPLSCPGAYDYDAEHLREYRRLVGDGEADRYVETYLGDDEAAYRERAVADRAEALAWTPAEEPVAGP